MSVPRSQAPQATPPQALDALLSHYPEGVKPTVRSHLSSLLQEFPGLQVKLEAFAQSDGRPPSLFLQVGGTIPISFLQVIYNIPLVIWLSADYPYRAPLVFVTPSPSMIIKSAHPLVDAAGFVSSPMLRSWVCPPSNLVDLIRSLCISFGHEPPLYSVTHPPLHVHDVKFFLSGPLPSSSLFSASPSPLPSSQASTSALSTSVSLLGPGLSPSQAYPLHDAQVSKMPASTSASLLGPGSLSSRFSSHGHVKEPSVAHQSQVQLSATAATWHQYHSPSVSTAWVPSSLTSAGYSALASSHPPYVYGAGVSMPHSASSTSISSSTSTSTSTSASASTSTSTSASLLGPGKISHYPAYDIRLPVAPLLSPSLSSSALTSTLAPASLLGPGKPPQMYPSSNTKSISSAHLSQPVASSSSSLYPSASGQWHPPHTCADGSLGQCHPCPTYADGSLVQWSPLLGAGVSMASPPTASTSASLLGSGSVSQRHALHAHVGGSVVHYSHPSTSAQVSSSLLGLNTPNQHSSVNHAHRAGDEFHMPARYVHDTGASSLSSIDATASNSVSLMSTPQNAGFPSDFLQQQHSTPPAQSVRFSNPIFGSPDPPPSDSRQSMMDTLVGRLQMDVDNIRKAKEIDMLKSMDMEGLLKQRRGLCDKGIQELQQQKETLELQLQTLLINTEFLETWLVSNSKIDVNIDVDDMFKPCDGLSKQLRECVALDLAIEDVMYCLDKAAQEGQLSMDSYLRYVKTLSREQFFHRAIATKVRAAQEQ